MLPKKVIGRYIGNDMEGVTVGRITFLPNHSVECNVNKEMYDEINKLCEKGIFHLFEYASTDMVDDVFGSVEKISGALIALSDYVTEVGQEVEYKFDDADYDRDEGELLFYSKEEVIRTVALPFPERPREIELSRNETHLLWRIKPISLEHIEWEELIPLTDIGGYDDTELMSKVTELEERIKEIENGY